RTITFANSVCRLRGLAARLVARRNAGAANRLLERPIGRRANFVKAADGLRSPGRQDLSGRAGAQVSRARAVSPTAGFEQAQECNALYDPAGCLQDLALSLYRPG